MTAKAPSQVTFPSVSATTEAPAFSMSTISGRPQSSMARLSKRLDSSVSVSIISASP